VEGLHWMFFGVYALVAIGLILVTCPIWCPICSVVKLVMNCGRKFGVIGGEEDVEMKDMVHEAYTDTLDTKASDEEDTSSSAPIAVIH